MMKKLFILLTMLLFVVSNSLMAQSDEPFTASVKVQFKTGDEVTTKQLRYALFKTTKKANEVKAILDGETTTTVSDITDGFDILREKISHMELCNGSALIVDMDLGVVAYTITSAGKFFPKVLLTLPISLL